MRSAPAVSVVIPTRDRRRLLARTLGSVLAQRDVELEVVVVDDGGSDGTAAALAALDEPRLRVVRNDAATGVSAARNAGARTAAGGWLAFCDDDDLWAPDKLARQLTAADAVPGAGWAYAGAVAIDAGDRVVAGYPAPAPVVLCATLEHRNEVPAGSSNVLVRTELFHDVGGVDATLHHLGDWDLWLRLARATPAAAAPDPLVAYRLHAGNQTLGVSGIVDEARTLARRHRADVDWVALHRWVGWSALRAGRRRAAAAAYLRAAAAGDRRAPALAAGALVVPGAGRRLFHRPGRGDTRADDWSRRAQAWIDAVTPAALDGRDAPDAPAAPGA